MLKAGKRAEVAQAQQDILKFVSTQQQLIKAQSNEAIRKSAELTDQIIPASKEQIDTAVLALQNARQTVLAAEDIQNNVAGAARDIAVSKVEEFKGQIYSYLNLALDAIGVDRSTALQRLNAAAVTQDPILTRAEFEEYLSIYQTASDAAGSAEIANHQQAATLSSVPENGSPNDKPITGGNLDTVA